MRKTLRWGCVLALFIVGVSFYAFGNETDNGETVRSPSMLLSVEDTDQLLDQHVTQEGEKNILTLVLDTWANPKTGSQDLLFHLFFGRRQQRKLPHQLCNCAGHGRSVGLSGRDSQ